MTLSQISKLKIKLSFITRPVASADATHYFWGARSAGGRNLPPAYVVFFLFNDLLGFQNLGKQEKVAWSFVLRFKGKAFVIEHRKMGVGVFVRNPELDESEATDLARLIAKAVQNAQPYFAHLAEIAIRESRINLLNKCAKLFQRYKFFRSLYTEKDKSSQNAKGQTFNDPVTGIPRFPSSELRREAMWLGLSAIDAFFSWTEHLFVHLALLRCKISTASAAADLAKAEWQEKFKTVFDLTKKEEKRFYDELALIRRQMRNFLAHGAFGKEGEAFKFHSRAGAVPVLIPNSRSKPRYTLLNDLSFREDGALILIEEFIDSLGKGRMAGAFKYCQETQLPTILTLVSDGTYASALSSGTGTDQLINEIQGWFDRSADMDW